MAQDEIRGFAVSSTDGAGERECAKGRARQPNGFRRPPMSSAPESSGSTTSSPSSTLRMLGTPRTRRSPRNEGRRAGDLIMKSASTLRGVGRGCDGGGTPAEGSALPRPRRNGCNRTRCRGTPDCRRPHGRTASVRTTPWLSQPVSRVEGARRSVSLSVTRCFDILARRRGEKWTRAVAEQAWS